MIISCVIVQGRGPLDAYRLAGRPREKHIMTLSLTIVQERGPAGKNCGKWQPPELASTNRVLTTITDEALPR